MLMRRSHLPPNKEVAYEEESKSPVAHRKN
jgi:hypothetical protein